MTQAVLCSRQNLFGSRLYTVIVRKINDKGMKLSTDDRTSLGSKKEDPMCQALWLCHVEGLTAGSQGSTLELGTFLGIAGAYVISVRKTTPLKLLSKEN